MQTRSLVLTGLMLFSLAGCQSYFPNSYGGTYSAVPPGVYGPPPGGQPTRPTYQQGRTPATDPLKTEAPLKNGDASKGQKPVPNYRDPGSVPNDLGTQSDQDDEIFRRPLSSLEQSPGRLDGFGDEPQDSSNDEFALPRRVQPASAVDAARRREVRKPTPGLYQCDRKGYTYLRGVVLRDPQSDGWRLKYSDDPTDGEMYGGVLRIIGDDRITGDDRIDLLERFEALEEGDTISVEGRIDPNTTDRTGRPTYRVHLLEWWKPKSR